MGSNSIINDSIGQLELQGIFITDRNFHISKINRMASKKVSVNQLNEIINIYKYYSSPYFSILNLKCEIEVIASQEAYIFFLQFKKDVRVPGKVNRNEDILMASLKEILDSLSDGVTICNNNGIYIYENEAEMKINGRSILGKRAQRFVDVGGISESAAIKVLNENKPVTIVQKYDNGRQMLVSAKPIRGKNGKIRYVVSTTRDMTNLKKIENDMMELERQNKLMNEQLKDLELKLNTPKNLIAHDPNMVNVVDRAIRVAGVDSSVLIQGESGVGKEGIANLIHLKSKRKDKRLITINCGAIPENLLESELFGYEGGAFTGAQSKGKQGLFEVASGGSIFLDEIGEMPLALQVKLLRVLQESEITRIGGHKPIPIDVRIIAATNRELDQQVRDGKFRQDLYYRLNIIPIVIPSLRERKDDIIPLVYHFLKEINQKYGVNRSFTSETLEKLKGLYWPGNVRQLKNLVERICLMVNKPEISISDIENELKSELVDNPSLETNPTPKIDKTLHVFKDLALKEQIEHFEREIIIETINQFPSVRKAAKALKVDQSTLVRKMQKYQIQKEISYEMK